MLLAVNYLLLSKEHVNEYDRQFPCIWWASTCWYELLICILMTPGWLLWSACKQIVCNTECRKNLPFHMSQSALQSDHQQESLRIMGRLLQCSTNFQISIEWGAWESYCLGLPSGWFQLALWPDVRWIGPKVSGNSQLNISIPSCSHKV